MRDHLLGKTPKDFDVATDARPEQVREVFGQRRTLAVGEAFGVIVVLCATINPGAPLFSHPKNYRDSPKMHTNHSS